MDALALIHLSSCYFYNKRRYPGAILESESNKESRDDKYNRVDLKVKNSSGEIIIIEVQYEREFDYLQRMLYGTPRAVTEHQQEGDAYSSLVKVISINILYFDLGHGSDYIYRGTTNFTGIHHKDQLQLSSNYCRRSGIQQFRPVQKPAGAH